MTDRPHKKPSAEPKKKVWISLEPRILAQVDKFVVPGKTRSQLINQLLATAFEVPAA